MKRYLPALALVFLVAAPLSCLAADQQPLQSLPKLVVTGEGEKAVPPDLAVVTMSVMRQAATASDALDADNDAMATVIASMKAAGIADRDLQTSGLRIMPQYSNPRSDAADQTPKITGYQVTNTITVRVRDLDKVGEIIDRSVKLGVNQGGDISFTNDDPSAALTEARKRAVADALARARTLAEAAGVKLGRILSISEEPGSRGPQPLSLKAVRFAAAVPIAAGENTYRVDVKITFQIED